jgi:hypothetical protein
MRKFSFRYVFPCVEKERDDNIRAACFRARRH